MTRSIRVAVVAGAVVGIAGMVIWDAVGIRENPTADIAATAEVEPWTGVYSTLGLIVWGVMLGALILAALVVGRQGDRRSARFFGVTALLAGYLAIDDALLLHEDVLPEDVGFPEPVFYMTLLAGTLAWLVVYRSFLLSSDLLLLGLAAAGFGLSIVGDVLDFPMRFEDGAKYVGLGAATGWAVSVCLQRIEAGGALVATTPGRQPEAVLNGPDIS